MKTSICNLILLSVFSFLVNNLQAQTNYSFSIHSILNAMPNGLRLPNGTIVRAAKITTGTGLHSTGTSGSGTAGPQLGGTFTGNTLPGYQGDHTPTQFTVIETNSSATIDNGISNNSQNGIGYRIYFDRPTVKISFLAVDIDGFNTSPGNAEWVTELAYNGTTFVPYDHLVDPALMVANITISTSSPTHTWKTLITNTLGAGATANLPVTISVQRAAGGGIEPDNLHGQVLFNPSVPTAAVTDFFLLWGIWQVPASPTVQRSGLSPIVVSVSPDFGDLPNTYQTLLASGGPSHGVVGTLALGTSNNTKADGTPSPLANADPDDDGVSLVDVISNTGSLSQLIGSYSLTSSFTNNTGLDAHYVAWIDWNNNGTMEAAEAQTATSLAATTSGTVTFTWTNMTLSGAAGLMNTYARIRATTEAITTADVGGAFRDGEIEDYLVPFALALPVKLAVFSGKIENDHASLYWKTEAEINSEKFEVQFSNNGIDFSTVGVLRTGNVNGVYTFKDVSPAQKANYYRLKIIDIDGRVTYSNTILLRLVPEKTLELQVARNPVRSNLNVHVAYAEPLEINIYDAMGQLVKKTKLTPTNFIDIDCTDLIPGAYILQAISSEGRSGAVKFIKE